MFEPIRGGTRGGQAEFKWSDVSADKDRENYLGHSINAPTGRWQKNKDVHWYNRDKQATDAERAEEIRKIKELEEEALAVALGFQPTKKSTSAGSTTSALSPTTTKPPNAMTPTSSASPTTALLDVSSKAEQQRLLEKEEKRQKKDARRAEKQARKEARRTHRHTRDDDEHRWRPNQDRGPTFSRMSTSRREPYSPRRSRSRSPRWLPTGVGSRREGRRDIHSSSRSRSWSRTPPYKHRGRVTLDVAMEHKKRDG